jgi:hypothetical protein
MLVFHGHHRVYQRGRDFGESHQPALFAVAIRQVGDELRRELVFLAVGVIGQRNDARNLAIAGKVDHRGFLVRIGFAPWKDRHRVRPDLKRPTGLPRDSL